MAVVSLMLHIVAESARPKRGRAPRRRGSKGENARRHAVAGRIGDRPQSPTAVTGALVVLSVALARVVSVRYGGPVHHHGNACNGPHSSAPKQDVRCRTKNARACRGDSDSAKSTVCQERKEAL